MGVRVNDFGDDYCKSFVFAQAAAARSQAF